MRSIFWFIVGILATVGFAYVHDNITPGPTAKPLVNWDQVSEFTNQTVDAARDQLNKITAK